MRRSTASRSMPTTRRTDPTSSMTVNRPKKNSSKPSLKTKPVLWRDLSSGRKSSVETGHGSVEEFWSVKRGESRKRAHTDHPATPPLEGYSAISGQKERKGKSHEGKGKEVGKEACTKSQKMRPLTRPGQCCMSARKHARISAGHHTHRKRTSSERTATPPTDRPPRC